MLKRQKKTTKDKKKKAKTQDAVIIDLHGKGKARRGILADWRRRDKENDLVALVTWAVPEKPSQDRVHCTTYVVEALNFSTLVLESQDSGTTIKHLKICR